MKRALLLVAICLAGLQACDNNEQEQLTPQEQELMEINNLIASQTVSGFDEQALLNDLKNGIMIPVSKYQLYPNGELCLYYPLDCVYRPTTMAFFDDGTCQEFYACNPVACKEIVPDDETIYPDYFCYCHNDYTWEYNPATKSLLTQNIYYKNSPSSAKVMYYDSVTHKLIIKGNLCTYNDPSTYMLAICYIDTNSNIRDTYLTKYNMSYLDYLRLLDTL